MGGGKLTLTALVMVAIAATAAMYACTEMVPNTKVMPAQALKADKPLKPASRPPANLCYQWFSKPNCMFYTSNVPKQFTWGFTYCLCNDDYNCGPRFLHIKRNGVYLTSISANWSGVSAPCASTGSVPVSTPFRTITAPYVFTLPGTYQVWFSYHMQYDIDDYPLATCDLYTTPSLTFKVYYPNTAPMIYCD